MTFNHAVGLTEAYYVEGRNTGEQARVARETLHQQHKDLLSAQATLRLSVESSDVDEAEALTNLAGHLVTGCDDYVNSFSIGGDFDSNTLFRSEVELKEKIAAWARNAGHQLQDMPARATPPQTP
ncbi:hypothetical protein [Streptomyces sp. NPDC055186]